MKFNWRFPCIFITGTISGLLFLYFVFLSVLPGGRNFGVTMIGILSFIFLVSALIISSKKNTPLGRTIRKLFRIAVLLFVLWIISFIAMVGMLFSGSTTSELENPDYLIILGAGINGTQPSLTLQERLKTGIKYLNETPDLQVIVTGGQGPGEMISEAEAMGTYLKEHGISESRIIYESASQSTMENFLFSSKVLEEISAEKPFKVNIVTSDFHLLRARMLAKRNGFIAGSISAPTPHYLLPANVLREYLAWGKSLIVDR